MNSAWLGVDTSNYTTSVSAVIDNGSYYNIKIPLCVKPSEKGVRQSDAVFMHTKNIPDGISELFQNIRNDYSEGVKIKAIGVSSRPRAVEGSYMPCFLAGVAVAKGISETSGVPLYEYSHQEGHIRAALFGAGIDIPEHFYSFHLSGGTCELLDVNRTEDGFSEVIIGESSDITLGQLVDRTGVMLGLQFPCGPELEKLAVDFKKHKKIKICGENKINLSGFENKVMKMINDGISKEEISAYVYDIIVSAVFKLLEQRADKSLPVLFAGGVSGSNILKERILSECDASFAPASLSSDNAVGIALLTKERYLRCGCEQ